MNLRSLIVVVLALFTALPSPAEEQQDPPSPGEIRNLLEGLTRLRITGYVHSEYVHSGELDTFRVRRARLNFSYQFAPTGRLVIQPDFSSGGATSRDAFVEVIEPWTAWRHMVTAGQFKVPFGFELKQSPRDREMPERTLVIRTLFPGDRDRGVTIGGAAPGQRFHYRVGVLNGNGIATERDADRQKDLVGRTGVALGPVELAVSGYHGTDLGFDKERLGLDAQWTTPLRGLGLRGEYIRGTQPPAAGSGAAARETDVDGWYVYAIQNLGTKHQLVLRIDEFDPDTGTGGDATRTIGGAYHYFWDANIKLTLAYELPRREGDDPDDDLLTIRVQYVF